LGRIQNARDVIGCPRRGIRSFIAHARNFKIAISRAIWAIARDLHSLIRANFWDICNYGAIQTHIPLVPSSHFGFFQGGVTE
jgi:hypothetical protein